MLKSPMKDMGYSEKLVVTYGKLYGTADARDGFCAAVKPRLEPAPSGIL